MDRLSALDASFLHAEDGTTHLHIGSCAVFEGPPPGLDELVALIAGKLPLLPRYRQKVRFVPAGLGGPVWVDDPAFDLAFHLRHVALPPPGDEDQLEALVARLMSAELDRDRSLWETWIVEGLRDDRWAIVSKVHHCMVDGIAGTDLMRVLLDADPAAQPGPIEPWEPQRPPTGLDLVVDAVTSTVRTAVAELPTVRAATRTPRRLLHQFGDVVAGLRSYGARLATAATPASIEGAVGPHRRWAAARCSLDDVRAVRSVFGGSVNDVLVAAVTGAFRELLLERGDDPDSAVFRSLVPMSVRALGDHTSNNQVTALIAELPVSVADPLDRLEAVCQQMALLKASHQAEAGQALVSIANGLPAIAVAAGVRAVTTLARTRPQRRVNTVITNVPGPQLPLYACGRSMVEYLPFVPLAQGVRVGVAVVSYNGRLAFGVTGDYDSVPDVGRMATYVEDGIAELVKLAADASTVDA